MGYEEGEDWVVSKMTCGYPRFFVHPTIQKLVQAVLRAVEDDAERERMRSAGLAHAATLTWDRAARSVDEILARPL